LDFKNFLTEWLIAPGDDTVLQHWVKVCIICFLKVDTSLGKHTHMIT